WCSPLILQVAASARPAELYLSVERFQLYARTAGAEREVELAVPPGAGKPDREVGFEFALERGYGDGGVRGRGDRQHEVAVVGGERVAAVVLDGALVVDIAIDGGRTRAARADAA